MLESEVHHNSYRGGGRRSFWQQRAMNKKLRRPISHAMTDPSPCPSSELLHNRSGPENLDTRRARYKTTTPLSDYTPDRYLLLA
jgi:hypothetical protein